MKKRNFKNILLEEIDQFVDNINIKDKHKTREIIHELFTMSKTNLLKDMGAQDIDDEGLNEEMDSELWEWFLDTCSQSIHENSNAWIDLLHKEKLKTLCYKYFTKEDLLKVDKLESDIRVKIRKYFTALQNFKDLNQFQEKISNLPSELLTNFTRYILLLSPELKEELKVTKDEFKKRVKTLKDERMKMIEKISLISKKYQSVLDITKLKELYDNGCFFEDNLLNRGVNEYVVKLLNYDAAAKKIKDDFSNTFVLDLKSQSENSVSYTEHVQSIKQETGKEFFTENGYQIGNRYENEIEIVKSKETEGEIIDNDSIYKEPTGKIKDVALPWETNTDEQNDESETDEDGNPIGVGTGSGSGGMDFGGGGGGSLGGGDFDFEEPTEDGVSPDEVGATGDMGGGNVGGGTMSDMDTETELPKDDEGFPVDFGSQETNPEAVEDTTGSESDSGMKTSDETDENK